MEFIQTHIPHAPDWEAIGQVMTSNTEKFIAFLKGYWLGITIGTGLVIAIYFLFFNEPQAEQDKTNTN